MENEPKGSDFIYRHQTLEHPEYSESAHIIRRLMAEGRWRIALPKLRRSLMLPGWDQLSNMELPEIIYLDVQRAIGWDKVAGRPFIGPGGPYVYRWEVAMDDLGRWVAGPSRQEKII